jgi:hypothetical protein
VLEIKLERGRKQAEISAAASAQMLNNALKSVREQLGKLLEKIKRHNSQDKSHY